MEQGCPIIWMSNKYREQGLYPHPPKLRPFAKSASWRMREIWFENNPKNSKTCVSAPVTWRGSSAIPATSSIAGCSDWRTGSTGTVSSKSISTSPNLEVGPQAKRPTPPVHIRFALG